MEISNHQLSLNPLGRFPFHGDGTMAGSEVIKEGQFGMRPIISTLKDLLPTWFHERSDQKRLYDLLPQVERWNEILRRFHIERAREIIGTSDQSQPDFAFLAVQQITLFLTEAQTFFSNYCQGSVICSFKVPCNDRLVCRYPLPPSSAADPKSESAADLAQTLVLLKSKIQRLDLRQSNAGVAFNENITVYVPDIKHPKGRAIGLDVDLLSLCDQAGITGVVVTPVNLLNPHLVSSRNGVVPKREAFGVFKVDLQNGAVLRDTLASQRLLGIASDAIAAIVSYARFAHCVVNCQPVSSTEFSTRFLEQLRDDPPAEESL